LLGNAIVGMRYNNWIKTYGGFKMETIALITDVVMIVLALYIFNFLLNDKSNIRVWLVMYFERKMLEEKVKLEDIKSKLSKDKN